MRRAAFSVLWLIVSLLMAVCLGTPAMAAAGPKPVLVLAPLPTPTRPIAVRFEGLLTRVSGIPGEWRIDEIAFYVTAETQISPEGYAPQVGDYAIVSATREGETLTATYILIREKRLFEFRGLISRLPLEPYDGEWLIGGVRVLVNSRATLITNQPRLSYYADVKGRLRPDRQVEATEIVVLDPQEVANGFEFQGPIEQMPPTGEGLWVIAGIQGLVDSLRGSVIEGAPAIGATAAVNGKRLADGTLFFERIRVLAEAQRQVRVSGPIEEMAEDYWVIGGQTVEILPETFIDESRCRAVVGMWAEATAYRCYGGSALCALRIRVERPEQ